MKISFIIVSLFFTFSVKAQSYDTLKIKSEINGVWEFEYFLESTGIKSYLRFGLQENDSSILNQTVIIEGNKLKVTEAYKLFPTEKLESEGFWYFWHLTNGVFISIETGDLFLEGIFEIKVINKKKLILEVCDKHDDCREMHFKRK
jgi:hypothetical protein